MIVLNAEPGGRVWFSARLSSGLSSSLSSLLYAAAATALSWLASGLGS
jgi:hypothetical protein